MGNVPSQNNMLLATQDVPQTSQNETVGFLPFGESPSKRTENKLKEINLNDFELNLAIQSNQKIFFSGQRGTGSVTGSSFMKKNRPVQRAKNKKVMVYVDTAIEFEVDISDPRGNLTAGWLLDKVKQEYSNRIEELRRKEVKEGLAKNQKPRKKKLIVALKTGDQQECIDQWLNQPERSLDVLKDGTFLIAHLAKVRHNKHNMITIDDFEQLKVIGRGGFSRVILARKKDTGRLYAIKILKKDRIVKEKKIKPLLSERKVLEEIGTHPFIIKMHWAFHSKTELFFVMDLCAGGELFFHLVQNRKFDEGLAKFYMTELLMGMEYLHEHDIVFRDLKPENILVDLEGHLRIADFGLSKKIPKRTKSYSFCGSPEYLSPEMINNAMGHDRTLDIYCLGVLLYEMLTGLPPFYDEDHQTMFGNILTEKPRLSQAYLSPEVRKLLSKMLAKEPEDRPQSIQEIKQDDWFKGINWDVVYLKKVTPPLVPDVNSCYFDKDCVGLSLNFEDKEVNRQTENESDFVSVQERLTRARETEKGDHNLGPNLTGVNATNLRRQSYYYESTINMMSFVEDQNILDKIFEKSVKQDKDAGHMFSNASFKLPLLSPKGSSNGNDSFHGSIVPPVINTADEPKRLEPIKRVTEKNSHHYRSLLEPADSNSEAALSPELTLSKKLSEIKKTTGTKGSRTTSKGSPEKEAEPEYLITIDGEKVNLNDFEQNFNEFDFSQPPPEEKELQVKLSSFAREKFEFKEQIIEQQRKREAKSKALTALCNTVKKEEVEHEPEPIELHKLDLFNDQRKMLQKQQQIQVGQHQITTIAEEFATNERKVSQIVSDSHSSNVREASDGFMKGADFQIGINRGSLDRKSRIEDLSAFKKDNIRSDDGSPAPSSTSSGRLDISDVQHPNMNVQVPDTLYISDNSLPSNKAELRSQPESEDLPKGEAHQPSLLDKLLSPRGSQPRSKMAEVKGSKMVYEQLDDKLKDLQVPSISKLNFANQPEEPLQTLGSDISENRILSEKQYKGETTPMSNQTALTPATSAQAFSLRKMKSNERNQSLRNSESYAVPSTNLFQGRNKTLKIGQSLDGVMLSDQHKQRELDEIPTMSDEQVGSPINEVRKSQTNFDVSIPNLFNQSDTNKSGCNALSKEQSFEQVERVNLSSALRQNEQSLPWHQNLEKRSRGFLGSLNGQQTQQSKSTSQMVVTSTPEVNSVQDLQNQFKPDFISGNNSPDRLDRSLETSKIKKESSPLNLHPPQLQMGKAVGKPHDQIERTETDITQENFMQTLSSRQGTQISMLEAANRHTPCSNRTPRLSKEEEDKEFERTLALKNTKKIHQAHSSIKHKAERRVSVSKEYGLHSPHHSHKSSIVSPSKRVNKSGLSKTVQKNSSQLQMKKVGSSAGTAKTGSVVRKTTTLKKATSQQNVQKKMQSLNAKSSKTIIKDNKTLTVAVDVLDTEKSIKSNRSQLKDMNRPSLVSPKQISNPDEESFLGPADGEYFKMVQTTHASELVKRGTKLQKTHSTKNQVKTPKQWKLVSPQPSSRALLGDSSVQPAMPQVSVSRAVLPESKAVKQNYKSITVSEYNEDIPTPNSPTQKASPTRLTFGMMLKSRPKQPQQHKRNISTKKVSDTKSTVSKSTYGAVSPRRDSGHSSTFSKKKAVKKYISPMSRDVPQKKEKLVQHPGIDMHDSVLSFNTSTVIKGQPAAVGVQKQVMKSLRHKQAVSKQETNLLINDFSNKQQSLQNNDLMQPYPLAKTRNQMDKSNTIDPKQTPKKIDKKKKSDLNVTAGSVQLQLQGQKSASTVSGVPRKTFLRRESDQATAKIIHNQNNTESIHLHSPNRSQNELFFPQKVNSKLSLMSKNSGLSEKKKSYKSIQTQKTIQQITLGGKVLK